MNFFRKPIRANIPPNSSQEEGLAKDFVEGGIKKSMIHQVDAAEEALKRGSTSDAEQHLANFFDLHEKLTGSKLKPSIKPKHIKHRWLNGDDEGKYRLDNNHELIS